MSPRISFVHQFEQQQAETGDLRFSFDGKRLVSTDDTALYLWRLIEHRGWEYERSLPIRYARRPSFAVDGKWLAFGDSEGIFRLYSLEDGKEERPFPFPSRTNGAFSPEQRWFVAGDMNRTLLLWDLLTSQYTVVPLPFPAFQHPRSKRAEEPDEVIEIVQFTPDGQRLALGAANVEGHGCIHLCHFDPIQKQLL